MTAAAGNIHDNVRNQDDIEIDNDNFDDLASTIGSDGSDFTSMTDSIRRHVFENGRRYHAKWQGRYVLPNDETEQNRLDMLHEMRKIVQRGNLHLAELPAQVGKVLDCGTGTGIWAVEFAQQYPEAQVVGVDLSPIQPDWVPANCSFEVDDLEQPWLWNKFDYIHSSDLAQSIRDWRQYVKRVFDHLEPGGVAEFTEVLPGWKSDDDSIPKGGHMEKYMESFWKACQKTGLRDAGPEIPGLMEEAGFVDLRVVFKKLPIGYWPKQRDMKMLGGYGIAQTAESVKSYGLALFTRELHMTQKEAEDIAHRAFQESVQKGVHTYVTMMYVVGKKPE